MYNDLEEYKKYSDDIKKYLILMEWVEYV
jgi:hypothetical protein